MKKAMILSLFLILYSCFSFSQSNIPAPIAPYSPGVFVNNTLYISGQIAINPVTKDMISGSIAEETKQVMENLGAVLKSFGLNYSNLVSCTVYLTDIGNYKTVNDGYGSYFTDKKYPARVAVQVAALPKGAKIEISAIAVKQ